MAPQAVFDYRFDSPLYASLDNETQKSINKSMNSVETAWDCASNNVVPVRIRRPVADPRDYGRTFWDRMEKLAALTTLDQATGLMQSALVARVKKNRSHDKRPILTHDDVHRAWCTAYNDPERFKPAPPVPASLAPSQEKTKRKAKAPKAAKITVAETTVLDHEVVRGNGAGQHSRKTFAECSADARRNITAAIKKVTTAWACEAPKVLPVSARPADKDPRDWGTQFWPEMARLCAQVGHDDGKRLVSEAIQLRLGDPAPRRSKVKWAIAHDISNAVKKASEMNTADKGTRGAKRRRFNEPQEEKEIRDKERVEAARKEAVQDEEREEEIVALPRPTDLEMRLRAARAELAVAKANKEVADREKEVVDLELAILQQ